MATEMRFPVEIDDGDAIKRLNNLQKEIRNLKAQAKKANDSVSRIKEKSEKADADVAKQKADIQKTEAQREPIVEQLKNAKDEAIQAYNRVEELKDALAESKERMSNTLGASDPRYSNELEIQKQIQAELAKQEKVMQAKEREAQRLEAADQRLVGKLEAQTEKLKETEDKAKGLKDELADAEKTAADFQNQIEEAEADAEKLKEEITALSRVKAFKGKVSSTFGKITSGIKSLFSKGKGIGDAAKQAGSGFGSSLKKVLAFGFGIRTLFALFNRLRSYISDAVQEFAKSDTETQGTIDALKSSLTGLKASWGAAFAPILNAVAPILQRLIAMLNTAAQAVAQFMAVLTGRGSFKKAVDSTGQLSDNLGGAAGNAKEAKKQLMGIDTLTVAQDTDSGGGGGGGSSATAFEDTAVDAESLLAKIAAAIKAGEWSQAATLLTDKLNEMVASVDWAGIGSQLGGYLDGALMFLAAALTTFDWMGLAGGLATLLGNVISSVDWGNLGTLFASKFRILLFALVGFLQNFDWGAAAAGISQFAIGFIGSISDAIQQVDWSTFGQSLWNGLVLAVSSIDWVGLSGVIGEALGAVIRGTIDLVSGFFDDAVQAVVEWWNENAIQDGEFVIKGLLQGIGNAIKNIGLWLWNNIIKPIIDGFKDGFGIHSPSTVMAEIGGNIIAGLKQGVINKINTVIQAFGQLKQKITDKLKSLVDTAKNINWADIGTNIVNGIIDGLNRAWQWLTGAIQQMCSNLLQSAKNILGIHSPSKVFREQIGENIGAGIEEGLDDSEAGLGSRVKAISQSMIDAVDNTPVSIGAKLANVALPPMPAVAMGGVVPPNAFSSGYGYGISPELESKLDALLERLTSRGNEQIKPSDVYLDKRKVGEIMYTYTEERNRGRGK